MVEEIWLGIDRQKDGRTDVKCDMQRWILQLKRKQQLFLKKGKPYLTIYEKT